MNTDSVKIKEGRAFQEERNRDHITLVDLTLVAHKVRKSEQCSSSDIWGSHEDSYFPLSKFIALIISYSICCQESEIFAKLYCFVNNNDGPARLWVLCYRLDPPSVTAAQPGMGLLGREIRKSATVTHHV